MSDSDHPIAPGSPKLHYDVSLNTRGSFSVILLFLCWFPPVHFLLSFVIRVQELQLSLNVLSFCPLDHLCIFLFYCVRRKFSKEEVQKADSCTPRDVCQCLEIVLVVMTEQGVLASCE